MYRRQKTISQGQHYTNKVIRAQIFLLLLFSVFSKAQDTHYSQFDKTKALINPSLISYQLDDYEAQLQRRTQWSSVTTPFNTFSLSFNVKQLYKEYSAGVMFLNCLLYTSPSPRDKRQSRMPSSA